MNWAMYLFIALAAAFLVYRMMPAKGVKSISPSDLKVLLAQKRNIQFIDVRERSEYKSGHVSGFTNIPLSQIKRRLGELEPDCTVVVMCHSGVRSMQAARILLKNGFADVRNASGGIMKWNASQPK